MTGFGKAKANDDDDLGDEDPNLVIEGLVDDAILDEKTQAEDLVIQKHL
jgi:mediator of replication checkpoint protein 1